MVSLQNDIEEHKADITRLQGEVKKRDSIISSLKNDIDGLKKEIQERDDTIQDKVITRAAVFSHVMTSHTSYVGKTYL